ncbi:MAG: aminotransferase class III-fold pyridoxal phosphate-dependent enzyme [Actinobacteria bacterium]|nr:aminotransferase class III-fold pyridoxal phosphate-dependent enzyme [Actinomycetota bacterium]
MTQGSGQQLYVKAKQLIPGGAQLLSKRPELFLPNQWPSYYSRAQGCFVWDLDGQKYCDVTISGIGACLLGFADPDVNQAVKNVVDKGNMCTLNAPQEVELAELLCDIHPWADMVRYARTGGESMAVAVRIARAYTGKDKVAICGYHGWSDWYLAANLSVDGALDGHLLSGLEPIGVPRALAGTVLTFRYNQIEQLEAIVAEHGDSLGAIVMEPFRFDEPRDGFLEQARDIATKNNLVLIFDEITAGWRYGLGGIHLQFGTEPDIAVFSKSISNGFPMAAVIGRGDVMQAAQKSFISSTYWTESIGPTAALATIKKMRELNVSDSINRVGTLVQQGWRKTAAKHSLKLEITGRPVLTHFSLDYGQQSRALCTLFTQEMLDKGYLANTAFYGTYAHTPEIIDEYLVALDEVFGLLSEAIKSNDVDKRLKGPIAHTGFSRLT